MAAAITATCVLIAALEANSTRLGLSSTRLPLASRPHSSAPRRIGPRRSIAEEEALRIATADRPGGPEGSNSWLLHPKCAAPTPAIPAFRNRRRFMPTLLPPQSFPAH